MFGDVRSCGGVDASAVLMYRIGLFYSNCMILMLEPISEKKSSAMAIFVIVWQVLIFGVDVGVCPDCPPKCLHSRHVLDARWLDFWRVTRQEGEASNTTVFNCILDLLPLRSCEVINPLARRNAKEHTALKEMAAFALPSSSSSSSMAMDDVAHDAAGAGPGQTQTNMAYTPRKFPEISIAELP